MLMRVTRFRIAVRSVLRGWLKKEERLGKGSRVSLKK